MWQLTNTEQPEAGFSEMQKKPVVNFRNDKSYNFAFS